MEHLQEQRMVEHIMDKTLLSPLEELHLSQCATCQQQLAAYQLLGAELAVARQSAIDTQTEAQLFSLFEAAGHAPIDLPQRVLQGVRAWVAALPLWDSRQQAHTLGVRSGNWSSYRMLFGTKETEVELMVEGQNGLLRIVGEVMAGEVPVGENVGATNGLALIELMTTPDAATAIETESDASGRFALEGVPPGNYVMTITPRHRQIVVIDPLELT
jgi:hypothetical protein